MDRAYAVLAVKDLQDEQRIFTGVATSARTDRMGDVIDPLGAKFRNPLPLLHQHDSRSPIGTVKFGKATADGIEFEAQIPRIADAGPLRDRVETAWGEIKAGLVRAVSIGFRVLEDGYEVMKNGGYLFKAIEILELSAVTIPANSDCTITTIRSIDTALRAASGQEQATIEEQTPPAEPVTAASPSVHVAKLAPPARAGAPFVINRINHVR